MAISNKDKESYVKATSEGRLYIETADFFKVDKVQRMVATLMDSDVYKQIEERKFQSAKIDATHKSTVANEKVVKKETKQT